MPSIASAPTGESPNADGGSAANPRGHLAGGRRVDLVRDHGHRNLAAALRYHARHTTRTLPYRHHNP